ncbi:MAG: DUF932 domain-containing protein [Planctomycetota bacterium]
MLMLSHASEVSRDELYGVVTPDPTDTWRPVPHIDVVNTLTERASVRGLVVTAEKFALLDGVLYGENGIQTRIPGARLFGSLDFAPIPGSMPFPAGCAPSCGLRNSADKSFALSILSGARVLVCANGVLSAEHIVTKKHTSRLDLVASIDAALDAFMESLRGFNETYEKLRAWQLRKNTAHSLIVELARAGAFASSDILPVVQEFENPRHAEFRERNAWNLYQDCTEIMKSQSPSRQVEGFKALNKVLTAALN